MNFSTYRRSLGKLRYGDRENPVRDWLVLLALATLALAIIVLWNVYSFGRIAAGGVIGPAGSGNPAASATASLTSVEQVIEARASTEASYESGTTHYADPSQ